MRNTIKLGLTALMAAMLLASALSTASARNLSISNQNFRVSWSRLEFNGGILSVRCQVTLEGSFHSTTIPKVRELLIGSITRITIKEESCEGAGRASVARPPPWHVTYEGFTGRLPNIESIRLLLQRFQFNIIAFGATCRYGTATDNVTGRAALNAAGEVTNLQPLAGRNIANLLNGPEICPPSGELNAAATDGNVTLLGTTTRIRITLI